MEIEIETDVMRLSQVIAIYDSSDGMAAVAHGIDGNKVKPDGRVIDSAALAEILTAKAKTPERHVTGFEFQPVFNRMLFQNPSWNVWYTAAQTRKLFFGDKAQMGYLPPLIWIGHRTKSALFVLAHAGKAVSPSTMCYAPKLPNVYADGGVCVGSMNPRSRSPEDWEAAFYDSKFSDATTLPAKPYAITSLKKIGRLSRTLETLRSQAAR